MKPLACFISLLLIFLTGCLDSSTNQETNFAGGIIEATFLDTETGDPVPNQQFDLLIEAEGFDESTLIGTVETDENGFVETEVVGQTAGTITRVIFEYKEQDETLSVSEDVTLELQFEEPFNTVSLEFEI